MNGKETGDGSVSPCLFICPPDYRVESRFERNYGDHKKKYAGGEPEGDQSRYLQHVAGCSGNGTSGQTGTICVLVQQGCEQAAAQTNQHMRS